VQTFFDFHWDYIAVKSMLLSASAVSLHSEHLKSIALYTGGQGVLFSGLLRLVPTGVESRMAMARDMLMFLMLPGMIWTTFKGTWSLRGSIEQRWLGTCAASTTFMRLYVATNLFQSLIDLGMCNTLKDLKEKLPMLLHHMLSNFCFLGGLFTDRSHFWACWNGCCEATSPFLMVLNLGRTKGAGVDQRVKSLLGPLWTVNGGCLWVSFIGFRLLLFPAWLSLFCIDIHNMGNDIWSRISSLELSVYPATTGFLLFLSVGWFKRIHTGLMKALLGGGDQIEKKPM